MKTKDLPHRVGLGMLNEVMYVSYLVRNQSPVKVHRCPHWVVSRNRCVHLHALVSCTRPQKEPGTDWLSARLPREVHSECGSRRTCQGPALRMWPRVGQGWGLEQPEYKPRSSVWLPSACRAWERAGYAAHSRSEQWVLNAKPDSSRPPIGALKIGVGGLL